MGGYRVRERVESGELLYELLDEEAALEATVWPALGCRVSASRPIGTELK